MKIIISHDVDHITAWEHKKDLTIPKFIFRNSIELAIRKAGFREYFLRFMELAKNKFQNLEELMGFDKENKVPSTFFVGVNNGLGLAYSLDDANYWIKKIIENGFDVGVHGIEFDNFWGIKKEYEVFENLSDLKKFGIRMHYLNNSEHTLKLLDEAGYLFDSTLDRLENPFKTGNLWEFPLHIMDSCIFHQNSRWQNQTLDQAKSTTQRTIEEADKKGINYLTVLFHDRYFSNSFRSWKDWYAWVVFSLKDTGFEFTTYREAIRQLEKGE